MSDDDEVMEDDAPLAPPKTLSDDGEAMEDAAPLAPPKRKRGSRNRTDRTNNLTLAPRSTERVAPQPASTSTHIERTDAPTRMTDGEGCNDEPAAQRPKKSPIARPVTVTWDEVINTILKGNAKAKRLMGRRYTYVVQHVGETLRGLERRDKRKANKLMRLCRTKWGGGITGQGQQVGDIAERRRDRPQRRDNGATTGRDKSRHGDADASEHNAIRAEASHVDMANGHRRGGHRGARPGVDREEASKAKRGRGRGDTTTMEPIHAAPELV